jgi:5-methylcytosine-specific restriction endonuclease McrA
MIRRDLEATAKRNFFNGRSFVRPDGREHLFGIDMELRRKQVWERSRGYCEMPDCQRIVTEDTGEMHHLKPRSKGGDESKSNLAFICRRCHRSKHPQVQLRRIA